MAQLVKNPPANTGETGLILGQEDPLEEEMATHSSIIAWKITWTEEPGGPQTMGSQSQTHLSTHVHTVPCDCHFPTGLYFEIQRQIKRKQWPLSYFSWSHMGFNSQYISS